MRRTNLCSGVGTLAAALALATTAQAGSMQDYGYESTVKRQSTVTFSGSDHAKDASYFYSGVIFALNRDLGRDGVVLRGFAGVPMYEYGSAGAPGGIVDGDGIQG